MTKEETLREYASRYIRVPKHLTADDGRKYTIASWDTHTAIGDVVEIVATMVPDELRVGNEIDGPCS